MNLNQKMGLCLAVTLTLGGCLAGPVALKAPSVPTAIAAKGSGTNVVTGQAKAPVTAVASLTGFGHLSAWLVPAAEAEVAGLDTTVLANAAVSVTDVATGQVLATGSTDVSGQLTITQVPANALVKVEVVMPSGAAVAGVVRTPAGADAQHFNLGVIGTDSTVAADFFRAGGIDPKLLNLVDNRVIAFLAELIQLKLDDEFTSGARSREAMASGFKQHKPDERKPRDANGEPVDEDAATTTDPVRQILGGLGNGEGDATLLAVAMHPDMAKSLAGLTPAEQSEVLIKTAFLLQHRGEQESEKADEDDAKRAGLPPEAPETFTITQEQVQALIAAQKAYTVSGVLQAVFRVKGMDHVAIGTNSIDVSAALLNPMENHEILDGFEAWHKASGQTVGMTTVLNNPVARVICGLRAAKKSEGALKVVLEAYHQAIEADGTLKAKLDRKPLRLTSQADMDALLAALSLNK